MLAVAVGVHQEEDAPVAQLGLVEVGAEAAAERAHDVLQLLVAEHLGGRRLLGVEHLAAQRQDGLRAPIAPLLGRAAGAVALDDEELALGGIGGGAVGQLARQVEPVADGGLARAPAASPRAAPRGRGRRGWRARRWPRRRCRSRGATAPAPGAPIALDRGGGLGVVEPVLGLALELGLLHVDREDRDDALADVLRRERDALGLDLLRLHEGAHRLDDGGVEAVLVGAARGRWGCRWRRSGGARRCASVHWRIASRRTPFFLDDVERRGVRRRLAALGDQLGEVVGDAVGVDQLDLLPVASSRKTMASPPCR